MAEKSSQEDRFSNLKAFLEAEYNHYWNFLKYQYDVRDKYIQFFMAALAALGALGAVLLRGGARNPGSMAESENFRVIAVLTLVVAIVGFVTFSKVLYQRKMTTESKQRLSGIRGRLLEMAGGGDDLKDILYPTDPSTISYLGGDPTVLRLLAFITALSGGLCIATFFCTQVFGILISLVLLGIIHLYKNYKLSKWDHESTFNKRKRGIPWWKRGIVGVISRKVQNLLEKVKDGLINLNDWVG